MKMNLGDVNVKRFGKENDYLVKIEAKKSTDENFIQSINTFLPCGIKWMLWFMISRNLPRQE